MTQVEDTIHVPGRLDHGFILEHARDDAVRDRAPCRKELFGEKWDVAWDSEQGEDGLVRVDGGYEQRCEVSCGLRGVQL